jgi:hypothetical protein
MTKQKQRAASARARKTVDDEVDRVRYVRGFTIPRSVATGLVLVHNHVQHTVDTPCGLNGFRAWSQTPDEKHLVSCRCGWSGLSHYRVRGVGSGKSIPGTYGEIA